MLRRSPALRRVINWWYVLFFVGYWLTPAPLPPSLDVLPQAVSNMGNAVVAQIAPALNLAPPAEPVIDGPVFPLHEDPATVKVTSPFGPRPRIPLPGGGYSSGNHKGIDLYCSEGDRLRAIYGGTVVHGYDDGGWGHYILLVTDKQPLSFRYAHLSAFVAENNTWVPAGADIGECGSSGGATASHLHLELLENGQDAVNPAPFLADMGLKS